MSVVPLLRPLKSSLFNPNLSSSCVPTDSKTFWKQSRQKYYEKQQIQYGLLGYHCGSKPSQTCTRSFRLTVKLIAPRSADMSSTTLSSFNCKIQHELADKSFYLMRPPLSELGMWTFSTSMNIHWTKNIRTVGLLLKNGTPISLVYSSLWILNAVYEAIKLWY